MKTFHLICNAHLDPVWLWEWEEGAAEAVSTFRVAADLCEAYGGFIFNHNEVTLYKWVEEFEPELFERIRRLVREGRWHIMGGWYLQPDCNMPSGESFVRQMLLGRRYFYEKFGVKPTTAINFDPFGHTRGLVQIMRKAGYDSYVFCRPGPEDCELPAEDFEWIGYDGSTVTGHRALEFYNSPRGRAAEKVKTWLERFKDREVGALLWGVGNHGGGPSREDMEQLTLLMAETSETRIVHSTTEAYFKELRETKSPLPRHEKDMNSWAVGCYTSQIRIKQKHRQLENELFMTEKMLSHAALQDLLDYPAELLHEALCDLMVSEFHDVLPGSSIQPVEEASLRAIDHGLEIVSRLKARAFFALASGQRRAEHGEIPILVYNPHPYRVEGVFECEFQLPDQNWNEEFSMPAVYRDGIRIDSQAERELSNLNLDWRKRVAFRAALEPGQMNRFDVRLTVLPRKPEPALRPEGGVIAFRGEDLEVDINCATGLIDRYETGRVSYLLPGAFKPLVIEDNDDAWGMRVNSFRKTAGEFVLMPPEEGTRFSGVTEGVLDSVRVIEDGPVRSVVEAVFAYGDSFLVQTYKLPKRGTELELEIRVHWNEKSKMLKLSVPTKLEKGIYRGQVAYGTDDLPGDGREAVAQKWTAVYDASEGLAFCCINDGIYGSDYRNGEIRLSLLRSPGYSGHPILERTIMPQDRYSSRIDQGERLYKFWFDGGKSDSLLTDLDRRSLAKNEKPFVLSFFPPGTGEALNSSVLLDDSSVLLSAFKRAEIGSDFILRLFEPSGVERTTVLQVPIFGLSTEIRLKPYELKTLRLVPSDGILEEASLMEHL